MLNVLYFCFALSFCTLHVKSQSSEYTWEDYDGTIPEKALLASDDPNNPIYVGMGKVGEANCTGTLHPGATEITVECFGVHTVKEGLKILTVKDPTRFQWLEIDRNTFWEKVGQTGLAVESGHDPNNKLEWSVGRTTTDNGTLEIGRIAMGIIYIAHENSKIKDYEVLVSIKEPEPPSKTSQDEDETKIQTIGHEVLATPKAPCASKEPSALNLKEPTVDTNVDLKVKDDAQIAPNLPSKEPSISKSL